MDPETTPMALTRRLLTRAAPLLRLPGAPDAPPEPTQDGDGLRCPRTGRVFGLADGVLDLLGEGFEKTAAQKPLDVPLVAWAYDRVRARLAFVFGLPPFETEAADMAQRLALAPGDVVLDVACGHGNFTLELARRVGPEGLVIGVDIASAMLRRAARHVRAAGVENVLLVRGDALRLPLADTCITGLNCSGGLHGIPDLPVALREFARVSRPGARLTASGFATAPRDRLTRFKAWSRSRFDLHFVDMSWLRGELVAAGYVDVASDMPSSWIGYCWGRRADE